jgi:hypothetical protein
MWPGDRPKLHLNIFKYLSRTETVSGTDQECIANNSDNGSDGPCNEYIGIHIRFACLRYASIFQTSNIQTIG